MLRPTKRFGALLIGAGLLFAIGTNIQSGWLLVLSSLLLASLVAGSVLPVRAVRRVEVERHAPLEAHQGDRVRVGLHLANRDRHPKLPLVVEDEHCSPVRVLTPSLGRAEGVRLLTTRVARRRGVIESSVVRISSSAPFGVAVARRAIDAPARTVVFPAVVPLGDVPAAWDAPSADRSTPGDARRGLGAEYLGIREYRTGDSMRHVHWPSTARHGSVMVREFEQERARSLTVVVDTLADVVPAGAERTPLDVCCSIAASVSVAAARSRRHVRLVAARDGELQVLDATDPGAILAWLAGLAPGGGLPLESVLERMDREILTTDSVVLATPSWQANDAAVLGPALESRSRVGPSALCLVDARGFGGRPAARLLPGAGIDALREVARRSRMSVVTIGPTDDLATVLRGGLRAVR